MSCVISSGSVSTPLGSSLSGLMDPKRGVPQYIAGSALVARDAVPDDSVVERLGCESTKAAPDLSRASGCAKFTLGPGLPFEAPSFANTASPGAVNRLAGLSGPGDSINLST